MALVHAELTATCNSLGCAGAEKYCIDPQCSEAVRDLIKFLRRDGDDHEIRRFLGAANIVETDLLPILLVDEYSRKSELFDLIVRLLVNLTTPALLIYNEQVPIEKIQSQYYLQIVSHLQKYKRAFTDVAVWKIIVDKLAEVIQAEYHEKGEEKVLSTVRLLILVRNILHVPADNDAECRPDNDANLHDQVLWAMHQSQLIDIIMYIVCSDNEQQYYLHALEIISLMLRDQNATELANASINRTETEKQRDEHELKIVLEKERKEKLDKLKKYSGSRHSRFGGRFVVSGMKSIGDNEMVVSSMTSNFNKAFDRYKKPLKTPRNRMALKNTGIERKSAFSVRLFLKEFCVEFLHGSYNTLMKHVREMLVRSKSQPNDESYYFWAMQFFMEFNRCYKFEIKLVSETMALNIFHFVQDRIEESREKLITDKKKIPIWSKRMHLGLKAYKELMETLLMMFKSQDPTLKSSARTILTNLFYMVEYRDLLLGLLNLYEEVKFSRMYLKDLIETNHVFMKLLEYLGNKQRNLIVQCKPKKNMKKKINNSNKSKATSQDDPEDNDIMWSNFSPGLKEIIEMRELVIDTIEARPYDPVSDVPMDDQKVEVMCRIRMHMRNKHLEEAVKLLRASREVWPEDNYFGNSGLNSDEELDIFKQIFYADLAEPTGYDKNLAESNDQIKNEDNETDEEEYEEASQVRLEEANFEFNDFVKKFAKPKILQNCCLLLKEFDTNSIFTNHAVVKLLHRITYDCKYSALMFQASVFRVFQKIFLSKNPNHKELKHFATFIIRKFTNTAKQNNKVFMELLFWKDLKVAYEIKEGYNVEEKKITNWSEEQEDELHRLHEEYLQDMPEEDELIWICNNLIRKDRSKVSILKKIKQLGIVLIRKHKRLVKEFSEAEILQITQLVNESKEANDPIGFIMDKLCVKHPKKHIISKILELGLVTDPMELRKKRSKNSNKSNKQNNSSEESDNSDNEEQIDFTYHSLTSVYVLNVIKKVIDKNMKPALLWLVESLNEAVDDLDVVETDIPLLPLTDECMTAVNDIDFQEAMIILGIHKPSSIQEVYWRIPGIWQANDIRQRSVVITNIIEGKFVVDDNTTNSRMGDSSDEDVKDTFDRIRKSFVKNYANCDTETTVKSLKSSSSVLEEPDKENFGFSRKKGLNKRKFLLEDDDSEQDILIPVKNKMPLDDSSDEVDSDTEKFVSMKKKKKLEDHNEEDKVISIKKKSLLNNSSDEEDSFIFTKENIVSMNKKKILLDSDEENMSIDIQSELVSKDNSNERNIDMKKNNIVSFDKTKVLTENIPIKEKSLLNDSSDEEDGFIFTKGNIVSMNKKKILLDDSDEENMPIDIQSKLVFKDNSDERNIDMKKNNIVSSNKTKLLVEDIDEDHHVLTAVKKKLPLKDSDERDSGNERSQMDMSGANKRDGSDKKKQPLLESSDSEEEIGMKKIKRFLNNDSD